LKFIDLDLSVSDRAAQQAGLKRAMIGNGEGLPCRIVRMSQTNMAPALTHHLITKALESSNGLLS
jgi:hypothetical protein